MKNVIMVFCGLMMMNVLAAQSDFNTCAAIFLKGEMVISEYSPTGVSKVSKQAEGRLQLRIIVSPKDKWEVSGAAQSFRVAIRDHKTGSLVMYGDNAYRSLEIEKVLAKCQVGDDILILSTNRELGISGAEIRVE